MGLSTELISQFAKITNDQKKSRIDEATLYGEVVQCDDSICVRFDGSEQLTPVTTITEKDENGNITNFKYGAASVKTGDRVSVSLKNHSATITGNLSDPPMGRAEIVTTEDSIVAKIDGEVKMQIDALGVKINGLVTITNGLENGTTTINGSCIKTGKIDAQYLNLSSLEDGTTTINGACIKTGKIDAQYLNLTGAITFGDLDSSAQGKINTAQSAADNAQSAADNAQSTADSANTAAGNAQSTADSAQSKADSAYTKAYDLDNIVSDWGYVYEGTTYIDGSKIMTGTVTATNLEGGTVYLLDDSADEAAALFLTGASSYEGGALRIVSGAIEINAIDGAVYIEDDGGYYLQLMGQDITCKGYFQPASSGKYALGWSNLLWSDVYAASGTINTSDETKKKDIVRDISRYNDFFDGLMPCSYRFIDGNSGRIHLGMIAQDIEKTMMKCGISDMDFAGFIKSPREDAEGNTIDGEYDYALRYAEFIPMLIWQVQKLKARVAELEEANG